MKRYSMCFVICAFLGLYGIAGCAKTSQPPASSGGTTSTTADHSDGSHSHSADEMKKVKEQMALLSPEDATAAEKQHVCPVSGEMLGTMGPPKKVDVKGKQVFICCEGCRDELTNNAEKYLAKLETK